MKSSRLLPLFALGFFALFLSACGSVGPASWPGISVDDSSNTVYVAYNQQLYALQGDNGAERWRFPAKRVSSFSIFAAPELSADGQLLFGGYDHLFYSIDPTSGQENWIFPNPNDINSSDKGASNRYIASPLKEGESIFAPNSNGILYALSSSGQLLWTFGTDQPMWGQPASDGELVYVTSLDHHLYALNAQSGQQIWGEDLGGTLVGQAVLNEGVLYVGTLNSEVVAIDAANGHVLWRATTDGWVWGSPTYYQGQILVGDLKGKLYALDAASGREVWSLDTQGAITGGPLVGNDHIYVVNEEGKVLSVSLQGKLEWTKTFVAKLYGSPVAAGDLLMVSEINKDGTIIMALDQNGDLVWSYLPK
jgi:outer membrane protein assembly factor BamB